MKRLVNFITPIHVRAWAYLRGNSRLEGAATFTKPSGCNPITVSRVEIFIVFYCAMEIRLECKCYAEHVFLFFLLRGVFLDHRDFMGISCRHSKSKWPMRMCWKVLKLCVTVIGRAHYMSISGWKCLDVYVEYGQWSITDSWKGRRIYRSWL